MSQAPLPTRIDLSDAPTDLGNLDSLFPAEPSQATAQLSHNPDPQQVAPPAPPAPSEPFVKGSKTVYKTREAAEEGINQKDALIDQLRTQYALATGVDPITKQPIVASSPQVGDSYSANPKRYADDLRAAKTDEDLVRIQTKLVLDTIQPMAPAIAGVTRANAESVTRAEIPDFATFYGSADYRATLDAVPLLKEAVEMSESDIRSHNRLPDLYKTVYLVSRGIQLPELLKRASGTSAPNSAGRPTSAPATTTPTGSDSATVRTVRTKDGRKSIIEDFESRHGKTPLSW